MDVNPYKPWLAHGWPVLTPQCISSQPPLCSTHVTPGNFGSFAAGMIGHMDPGEATTLMANEWRPIVGNSRLINGLIIWDDKRLIKSYD